VSKFVETVSDAERGVMAANAKAETAQTILAKVLAGSGTQISRTALDAATAGRSITERMALKMRSASEGKIIGEPILIKFSAPRLAADPAHVAAAVAIQAANPTTKRVDDRLLNAMARVNIRRAEGDDGGTLSEDQLTRLMQGRSAFERRELQILVDGSGIAPRSAAHAA
jgi:hypothetical protein